MSHVDDGTLHALVDNELDAAERSQVELHLAACGDCARRFAEATAMARQVVTLLGALDAPESAVRVVRAPAVVAPAPDIAPSKRTLRSRLFTLRRVALAASVLLVAGVSYQVGKGRDGASAPAEKAMSVRLPTAAAPMRAVPSVVDGAADSFVAAAPPSARLQPRGGPRNESDVIPSEQAAVVAAKRSAADAPIAARPMSVPLPAVAASEVIRDSTAQARADSATASRVADEALGRVQAQEQARAQQGVPAPEQGSRMRRRELQLDQVVVTGAGAPARQAASNTAPATVTPAAPKVVSLEGYTTVEEESVPAMTRRRYVSSSGVSLILSIAQSTETQKAAPKETRADYAASSYVVTTENSRSTVRWRSGGLDYVLQGALAPDSLVKLATKLKP